MQKITPNEKQFYGSMASSMVHKLNDLITETVLFRNNRFMETCFYFKFKFLFINWICDDFFLFKI